MGILEGIPTDIILHVVLMQWLFLMTESAEVQMRNVSRNELVCLFRANRNPTHMNKTSTYVSLRDQVSGFSVAISLMIFGSGSLFVSRTEPCRTHIEETTTTTITTTTTAYVHKPASGREM